MEPNTQVDPLKIVTRLRERLSSSILQEAMLESLLADSNTELMKLRERNATLEQENAELAEDNCRLEKRLEDEGITP